MPAKNPRINVTLDSNVMELIVSLADQENVSVSGLAKELIIDSLERREDLILSSLASSRDVPAAKRVKHKNVW